jgi:hypothetical protein
MPIVYLRRVLAERVKQINLMTLCLYVLNVEVVPKTEPDSRPTSVGYCINICADIATHNIESQVLEVLSV